MFPPHSLPYTRHPLESAEGTVRHLLQRLFSAFPNGWPGITLLVLRAVLGSTVLAQGQLYLRESNPTPATLFVGVTVLAVATLLLIGLATPIAGAAMGLLGIGIGLSVLPASPSMLFEARLSIVFAGAMLMAIIVLGPGAFSVDARLFGRRKIIIPPPSAWPR